MSKRRPAPAPVRLRLAVVDALESVLVGHQSLDRAVSAAGGEVEAADRSLLSEISYGVLRWYDTLDLDLQRALRKPLRGRDRDLHYLLLASVYQLRHLRVPDYAVVDSAVAATRFLGRKWAGGLVNAVLRKLADSDPLSHDALPPTKRWSVPAWIWNRWQADWGGDAQNLAAAGCHKPPMWLRVDLQRTTRDAVAAELARSGLQVAAFGPGESALRLAAPAAVETIPGFATGIVSVQDAAAQLAAPLLAPRRGERVLDACAAPGGKSLHLLEQQPALAELVALDVDPSRLARIEENLSRCDRRATLVCADASQVDRWWDGRSFDRILLDAPCSGSGVIRRHPDIKYLRREDDLPNLAALQRELLDALWPLVAGGGMLLYSTCSVFKQENQEQVADFLARHADARAIDVDLPVGRRAGVGWQILTGEDQCDGFFYCLLCKTLSSDACPARTTGLPGT